MAAREPAPAVPEAAFAGPWRVVTLYGAGSPEWGCVPDGGREPVLVFDSPDLASLAAAALEVAERPARFRFRERPARGRGERPRPDHSSRSGRHPDPDLESHADPRLENPRELEVLHDGHPVGSAALAGDTLPVDLTRLADLRACPRALAHLLLAVPEEVLRRAGAIVAEMAGGAGGSSSEVAP